MINIFTAFGYFEDEEENLEVIHGVSNALKKGGKFLLETVNREWIIRNFRDRNWERIERGTFSLDERELDLSKSRIRAQTLFIGKDKRSVSSHSLRLYTLKEMSDLLKRTSLKIKSVYGGLDGTEFNFNSKRMVILAEKKEIP